MTLNYDKLCPIIRIKEKETHIWVLLKLINYVGPINKNKTTKEYYDQIKKILNSKLSSFNKVIAHSTFPASVFITSVGIVDWTINEIKEIDSKKD